MIVQYSSNSESPPTLSQRKAIIAQHFAQAEDYNAHASVQAQVCQLLIKKIHNLQQTQVLEIGAGQGQLTTELAKHLIANHWLINELANKQRFILQSILPQAQIHIGDGETLVLSDNSTNHKASLIISANAIQWFDNPLSFIAQSARNLQDNGQLLFSTFTPNNFFQIKELTSQGLNYPSVRQWENELLKYGFIIKEISCHRYDLQFDSPLEVLKHIKKTGVSVNNANGDNAYTWSKSSLKSFINDYQQRFHDSFGKVILTYEALIVNATKT